MGWVGGLLTTMTFETFCLEICEIGGACCKFSDGPCLNGVITSSYPFLFVHLWGSQLASS